MRYLLLFTFMVSLVIISVLRSTGPDRVLVQEIRSMAELEKEGLSGLAMGSIRPDASIAGIEKMMVEVPFSAAELEKLDALSQRFPASVNAFHKLCALERLRPQLSDTEYTAVAKKYLSQFESSRKEAEALLKTVADIQGRDDSDTSLKRLAHLIANKLDKSTQRLDGALNAAMITTTLRAGHLRNDVPVAEVEPDREIDTD